MPRIGYVAAGTSLVTALPGTIANNGVASTTVTLTLRDSLGYPVQGLAAARCVLSVNNATGVTITQPTGVTDSAGRISGSAVCTSIATKVFTFTVCGLAVTATASVVVTGGSITYPNEASGLTAFAEHNLTAIPNGANGILGSWLRSNPDGYLTTATEASAPQSPSGVVNFLYPNGFAGGASPALFTYENTTQYRRLYTSYQMRIVEATYENHSVFTKINFWGAGTNPVAAYNDIFMVMLSPSAGRTHAAFQLAARQQNVVSRNLNANINTSSVFTCATWHQVEIELVLNSAVDVADGEWRWWVDGTLCGEYTNVVYRTTAQPAGLRGFKFDPTYGGVGDTKTGNANWQVDHVYLSGELL